MAVPVANQGRRDGGHDDFGSPGISYGPQPGSPTLTNPDMILPDYDEGYDEPAHPALAMWNHVQRSVNGFQDSEETPYMAGGALPPVTPIIYGNGTMLSDIGEVTEVESTVGGPLVRHHASRISMQDDNGTGSGSPLRSSPTILSKRMLKKRPQNVTHRERRSSLDSSSSADTIGAGENAQFGDMDDTASVDDSNFQGDDEESVVSEFMDEPADYVRERRTLPDAEKRLSTHSISRRAEQILANAKRRLNTMEGNLNRARTFSYSSISDGSAPNTPTHSRNVSENNVPGPSRSTPLPQRSASALGSSGGYRPQVAYSRSAEFTTSARSSQGSLRSPQRAHDSMLEPLDEDETAPENDWSRLNGPHHGVGSPYNETGLTRSASVAQVRDLQDQMQGLKGRISNLREQAKADSMKRRSLQSMRTPSPFTHSRWDPSYQGQAQNGQDPSYTPPLDSPRDAAPEPETADIRAPEPTAEIEPEVDDSLDMAEEDIGSGTYGSQDSMETQRFEGDEVSLEATYHDRSEEVPHLKESSPDRHLNGAKGDSYIEHDALEGTGDHEHTGFDGYVSESGESLYHDTYQEQDDDVEVTISHEDREDAFDYEHFFLHSAMGAISRQSMNRRDSFSSTDSADSVETTRGPARALVRRPSTDTTTSVDTFATAREGAESRSSHAPSTRRDLVENEPAVHALATACHEDDNSELPTSSQLGPLGHGGDVASASGSGSGSETNEKPRDAGLQRALLHRKGGRMAMALHRPSVSSFESTGTNRSFPLLNKSRLSGGVVTPSGSSDQQFKHVAASLLQETSSTAGDKESLNGPQSPAAQSLSRDDQTLVEAVVTSLGRCVLGLSEATRLGTGNIDELRKRLDAARRLLEGGDGVSDTASSDSAK